jgi:hypothetical protein
MAHGPVIKKIQVSYDPGKQSKPLESEQLAQTQVVSALTASIIPMTNAFIILLIITCICKLHPSVFFEVFIGSPTLAPLECSSSCGQGPLTTKKV